MQTGSFFTQGSTHMVCEDYALNGVDYAIVSDGCSNGGGPRIHTDFGSRLLAKAAEEHLLKINGPFELFMQAVCSTAQTQQRSFPNLPVDCLTATLLTAVFHEGLFKVNIVGDGLVAARKKDKTWEIRSYDFVPGGETGKKAPYYLKYDMMNQRQEYFRLFGGVLEESLYSGPLVEATEFTSKAQVDMKATDKVYVDLTFPINEYDLVCICSRRFTRWSRRRRANIKLRSTY